MRTHAPFCISWRNNSRWTAAGTVNTRARRGNFMSLFFRVIPDEWSEYLQSLARPASIIDCFHHDEPVSSIVCRSILGCQSGVQRRARGSSSTRGVSSRLRHERHREHWTFVRCLINSYRKIMKTTQTIASSPVDTQKRRIDR